MTEKQLDKQRKRSPNFPYVSVKECVDLIKKLHIAVGTSKVPIVLAFKNMGLTPKSSTTDRIRASLSSYKFIEEEIVNKEKFIHLTDLSHRIAVDTREVSDERLLAYRQAALNDPMMKKIWEADWKRGLPKDDATIISILRIKYGFQEEAAKRFAVVMKENYRFCELEDYFEPLVDSTEEQKKPHEDVRNPLGDGSNKQDPPEEIEKLTRFPIPLDGKTFAYIYLPTAITENDAEYIPDFVNLLLKKIRKTNNQE